LKAIKKFSNKIGPKGKAIDSKNNLPYDKNLKFSSFEIVAKYFCLKCSNKELIRKEEMYREADKIVKRKLNIITILKKIQQIDNIKIILFDKNQLAMFTQKSNYELDAAGKEICNEELKEKRNLILDQQKMTELVKKFQIKANGKDFSKMSVTDKRLLKYLSNEHFML
jgi:hypothetical protein